MISVFSLSFLKAFLPEILSVFIAFVSFMLSCFIKDGKFKKDVFHVFATISIALLIATAALKTDSYIDYYDGFFASKNLFANFVRDFSSQQNFTTTLPKLIMLIFLALFTIYCFYKDVNSFSLFGMALLCFSGAAFLICATSFLSLYLALEMQAIPAYIIAASGLKVCKKDQFEGVLKYFILSAVMSCLLLYGISIIYFNFGHFNFDAIIITSVSNISSELLGFGSGAADVSKIISPIANKASLSFGFALIIVALLGKLGCAPFQFWVPDLYTATKKTPLMLLSTMPKVSVLIALALVLKIAYWTTGLSFVQNLQVVSIFCICASFVIGAFGGIRQTNLKRLIAYSAILNAGFMALGVLSSSVSPFMPSPSIYLLYILFYGLGVFSLLSLISVAEQKSGVKYVNLESLNGLAKKHPLIAALILCSVFSLIGVPPFAGFVVKFAVLYSAIVNGYIIASIFGVLASVVACFYYLKILNHIYFKPLKNEAEASKFYHCSTASKAIIAINVAILVANLALIFTLPKLGLFS